MRNRQVVRQWKFLLSLDAHRYGLTFEQLAVIGQVSVRTVYRDIDALTIAGFPVSVTTDVDNTRVTLDRSSWQGGERVIFNHGQPATTH